MKNYQDLIYKELSFKIVGLLYTVHNELGRNCNEKQYGDKLEELLKSNGILYERELVIPPSFPSEAKGRNKADFIVDDKIVLEFKVKRRVGRVDFYQLQRYLRALNKKLGILVNFQQLNLTPKRILNSDKIDY
ncbi:GxxExxY protein [Patescibacteria group bacterium]|nr:GxxExxY protein [Patescibacteria group bacterium]